MIIPKTFFKIFKNSHFSKKELHQFYRSSRQLLALMLIKGKARHKILEIEEKYQWPVLKQLNNPDLPIYAGADKKSRDEFIRLINAEMEARLRSWGETLSIIEERTEIYKQIFSLTKKDIKHCQRLAERYEKLLQREKRKRIFKTIGVGAGIAVVAGAGAYLITKKKNGKK